MLASTHQLSAQSAQSQPKTHTHAIIKLPVQMYNVGVFFVICSSAFYSHFYEIKSYFYTGIFQCMHFVLYGTHHHVHLIKKNYNQCIYVSFNVKTWLFRSILSDAQMETIQDEPSELDDSFSRNSDDSSTSNLHVNLSSSTPKSPKS